MEERGHCKGGGCGSNLFLCITGSGYLKWEDGVYTVAEIETSIHGFWSQSRFCQLICQPLFVSPHPSWNSYASWPQLHLSLLCSHSQNIANQPYFQTLLASFSKEKANMEHSHCHNPAIPSPVMKHTPRHCCLDEGLCSAICCGFFHAQLSIPYLLYVLDFPAGRIDDSMLNLRMILFIKR